MILGTIFKMDKGETQTNGIASKEVDDYVQGLSSKS